MNRQRGVTMVELLVSLAVVMLILGAATTAYLKLLRTYKTQGRLAESYIANLTGLELLRYDIEMAGFGLPAGLAAGVTYSEAAAVASPPFAYNPATLNDSPNVPQAFEHLNNLGANSSDVLTIRSSAANAFNNPAGKKWSMITNHSGSNPTVKAWGDSAMDFQPNDRFIILDSNGNLLPNAGPWGCYPFNGTAPSTGYYSNAEPVTGSYNVPSSRQVYYIYGLDSSGGAHNMPFNRVDYYLDNTNAADMPSSCAAGTYILYRSTIDQATGRLNTAPLIDCVRDFQVAFGLDPSAGTDTTQTIQWQDTLSIAGVKMSAAQIQQQLREVRVFLLCQEGLGDTSKSAGFRFSGTMNLGDQDIAHGLDSSYPLPPNNFAQWSSSLLSGHPQLHSWTPTGKYLQYRWKIIEIAVKPMNLMNLTNLILR